MTATRVFFEVERKPLQHWGLRESPPSSPGHHVGEAAYSSGRLAFANFEDLPHRHAFWSFAVEVTKSARSVRGTISTKREGVRSHVLKPLIEQSSCVRRDWKPRADGGIDDGYHPA